MAHTYSSIYFHYIFSTKNQQKIIRDDLQERLWAYMGGRARENDMDTGFANVAYEFKDIGKLSAYSYLIDFNESKAQNTNSNQEQNYSFWIVVF